MLNIAVIMGRLTADPELKHTPNGIAVNTFTVAVDRGYAKPGTEKQTDFINVVAWRNTAEFVSKFFKKGDMIAVNGSIQVRNYTDNNGVKRYVTEIIADNVNFTGSKKSDNNNSGYPAPPPVYNEPATTYSSGNDEDFREIVGDDDLPF